jgi:membrane protease YdiL (CAAX protease family)
MGDARTDGQSAIDDRGQDHQSGSVPRGIAVAVGLGLLGPVLAFLAALLVGLLNSALDLPLAVALGLGLVAGQWVAFAGFGLWYLRSRSMSWPTVRSYLGIRVPSLREVGIVVGAWLVIITLLVAVAALVMRLGAEPAANQSVETASQNPAIIPLLVLASFLVIGPSEELLYRGVVQGRLREVLSPVPAILIASAVFAFVHVMALTGGVGARLTTVAILFVPSLVFGAIYEYTGNLVVPALTHGLHNAVLFTLLYVSIAYGDELPEAAGVVAAVASLPV